MDGRLAQKGIFLTVLLFGFTQGDPTACDELKQALWNAAESGLHFYAIATSNGATIYQSAASRNERAGQDMHRAVLAKMHVDAEGEITEVCGEHASIPHRLFMLLLLPKQEGRDRIAKGRPLDSMMELMSELSWVELLHSGWPVFQLAALVEQEYRETPWAPLAEGRLDRQEPAEGCNEEQEALHEASSLFAAEGLKMRLHYVRDYLSKVPDDVHADLAIQSDCAESVGGSCKRPPGQNHSWRRSGMGPIQDGRAVSGAAGCLEAVAVAYAAMADALQCYLRRPESHVMHHFVRSQILEVHFWSLIISMLMKLKMFEDSALRWISQ